MHTKSLKIAAVLLVILSPLFIAGCKKRCPKPAENVPGTSTFRSDCPYEDVGGSDGPRELTFYFLHDNTDAFQEQIQAFQSQHAGLNIRTKKFTDPEEYEELVINELAEGEGPDVFMIHNSWITKHYKKLLPLPLDQPIVMNPALFRETFFQAAAQDMIIDEQIYGMPLSMDNLALFYNKSQFRDLLASSNRPAELWEGIKEQAFQLTKRNNSPERFALAGIALGRADNISSAIDILYAMMIQFGAEFYNDAGDAATFANNQPGSDVGNPGVEAFTLFTSFALPSYKHYSWNETITGFAPEEKEVDPFVRGKVSMVIGYPYLYDRIVQRIQTQQKLGNQHIDEDDIGFAPLPQLVGSNEATRRDTYASYFPLVVSRTSDVPHEAWSFIQFLTSQDALQTYHKKTNRPTSRLDMVTEQQTDPIFGVFAFQAPFAKSVRVYDDKAYRAIFAEAIQSVINNEATPESALKKAQDRITCIVRKERGLTEAGTEC